MPDAHVLGPRVLHFLLSSASFYIALPSASQNAPYTARLPPTFSPTPCSCQSLSAMGKSRSATCVIAYLMQKYSITPSEALASVQEARSIVEPNQGFMEQLELYAQMQTPPNVEDTPAYQRWVYQREIELSRACGQAPEADKIRFEDEHATDEAANFELRCRKCRQVSCGSGVQRPHPLGVVAAHVFLSAYTYIGDHLQRLNISSATQPLRLAMNTTRIAHYLLRHPPVPIISWTHCHGCDPSSSRASWTDVSNAPGAVPM